MNNNILTKENLQHRGWIGDGNCAFCSSPETVTHLFIECPYIANFWITINNNFFANSPINLESIEHIWIDFLKMNKQTFKEWGTLLAAFIWCVWLERNNVVFNKANIKSINSLYNMVTNIYNYWTGAYPRVASVFHNTNMQVSGMEIVPVVHSSDDEDLLGDGPDV